MSNPFESYGRQQTNRRGAPSQPSAPRPSLASAEAKRPAGTFNPSSNPFEAYAGQQMNSTQRRKIEREEGREEAKVERQRAIMAPSPLEKRRIEKAELMRQYRAWRREVQDEIVRTHGSDFAALMRLIRNLSWPNADKVVDFVLAADWLRTMDESMRLRTLDFIESSFCRARVREGLPIMDDGIWDEPLTPFIRIRRSLFGH